MAAPLASVALATLSALGPQDTIVVGTLSDPASLAPHRATDLVAAEVVTNVCETLVRLRPGSLRPEGVLATAWATRDERVWTLTLREGVVFHDGTPLDAAVVAANLEHLRSELGFPGRAVRVGPLVVELTLDRPNAALLSTLSQPFFAMQSLRQLAQKVELPVGTGPFRVAAAGPGRIELEAVSTHWAGPPRTRRLVFLRFPDEAALAAALEGGEADVTAALGPARAAELRTRRGVTLDTRPGLSLTYLAVNNERPPWSDARARRALSRSVDRAALVRDLLAGHADAAHGTLPPALLGPDTRARELVLDREAARRLLADAHVAPGYSPTLTVSRAPRPYLLDPLRVARRLQEDLAEVGVSLQLREEDSWAEQVRLTSRGEYELALLGWRADTLDPNDFLTALLDSRSVGTTNRSRYRSAAMDGLLKRARQEAAPHARLALYRQAQDLVQVDMPLVPLYHSSVVTAYRPGVRGLVIGPTGTLRYDKAWKQQ
jgi:peptide/nickel transport system substrate-binding protein